MSSGLPPDQSLHISTLDERLIILSVSEEALKIGAGTNYPDFTNAGFKKGVYLYTENLAITSDISSAQGLTISTWSLQCPRDKRIVVNTSGSRGEDGVNDENKTKANGADGGILSIFVQDFSDATANALELRARGGDGGNTYLVGGHVGNGGKGGTINGVFQPTYVQLLPVLDLLFNREEFHPEGTDEERDEQYNRPVTASSSIYADAKAAISLGRVLSASQTTIDEIFKPLTEEISKIDKGETRTILDVKIGLNNSRHNLDRFITNQQSEIAPTRGNIQGGYPGRGVNGVDVEPGKPGSDGSESQVFLKTWAASNFTNSPIPIAHPLHCSMLLERANLFFYANSPSLRVRASSLYQRIIDRLSFLPLEPEDPLYKAYEKSDIVSLTALADLETIKSKATNWLIQLSSGRLNYNGLEALWVPRASYTSYSSELNSALKDLAVFETAYIKYNDALKAQENLNDGLKLAYTNTSAMLSSLKADQEDLRSLIQTTQRKIEGETPVVEKAREELMEAYEAEIDAITSSFGLTFPQIINALTMIAFSPTALMGIVQGTDLIYEGFTEIPTTDGTISATYLASEFRQSEGTIKNISTLLKEKIDGTYELDDPFATRLIVEKEELLSQLDQFSQGALGGVHDADTRKNLEDKFDALIDAMTMRNGFILDYNIEINLLLSKIEEAAAYKTKETELIHQEITHNDPDLPAITSYVSAIYQASRSRVMKLIDMVLRSLNFRMVITSDVYNYAFRSGDPEDPVDLDKVPLSLTSIVLEDVRSSIEEEFHRQVEHWGAEPAKFPGNFDTDEGKRFRLSRYELEALLEDEDHTVVITIPAVDKYSKNAGDFEGCCNIRIYRIRFALFGLKTSSKLPVGKDALVKFTLTHGGNETILDRSNAAFDFKHEPVSTIFSFRLNAEGHRSILDNGNVAQSDINELATSYAAPGPFTEWTISMNGTDWKGLDINDVTDGYFDFCGTNYPFY